ncbi:hypothetical protein MRX96_045773 [Rhipicephalus microplus]
MVLSTQNNIACFFVLSFQYLSCAEHEEDTIVDGVDACYSKKEAAHPLYKQYTAYLGQTKGMIDTRTRCMQQVLGAQGAAAAEKSECGKNAAPARG